MSASAGPAVLESKVAEGAASCMDSGPFAARKSPERNVSWQSPDVKLPRLAEAGSTGRRAAEPSRLGEAGRALAARMPALREWTVTTALQAVFAPSHLLMCGGTPGEK